MIRHWNHTKQVILALVLSLMTIVKPTAVYADDANSKGTSVNYSVTEQYTWTVHSLVDFGYNKGANNTSVVSKENAVVVTKCVIRSGHMLKISLDTGNDFRVSTGTGASLNYSFYNRLWNNNQIPSSAVPLQAGDTVLTVQSGVNSAVSPVTFCLNTAFGVNVAEIAGDYTGLITYKAEVVSDE